MDLEILLTTLAIKAPYIVILGVLVLTGFGLPIPEELILVIAGYLCGIGAASMWIMVPAVFLVIIGADSLIFFVGRRYGHHVPRLPLLRRFLTPERLSRTEAELHKHGGKFIFAARFLPGLRTAAIFTAGTFKLPAWKFLIYDGGAALVSVPTIMLIAYESADHIDSARRWISSGQRLAAIGAAGAIAAYLAYRIWSRKRVASASPPG